MNLEETTLTWNVPVIFQWKKLDTLPWIQHKHQITYGAGLSTKAYENDRNSNSTACTLIP